MIMDIVSVFAIIAALSFLAAGIYALFSIIKLENKESK